MREQVLSKLDRKHIVRQIFRGLTYIHSNTDKQKNKISHRDVKPENILIVCLERDGSFQVKYADFDSAKLLEEEEQANRAGDGG